MAARAREKHVLYLEFGVFEGASLRWWSNALQNPRSELHGFDSFRGLPETFDAHSHPMGRFDRGGQPPVTNDPRVHFHVGWFEDTLPSFKAPPHEQLIVVMDADLYSSTRFALDQLASDIQPGAIIYFDELSRVDHEPAAFADFYVAHGRRFETLVLENTYNTGAFMCTG